MLAIGAPICIGDVSERPIPAHPGTGQGRLEADGRRGRHPAPVAASPPECLGLRATPDGERPRTGLPRPLTDLRPLPEGRPERARTTTRDYAAFSSDSSAPSLRQSHSMHRRVVPRFVSFLRTNLALQIGHGCGIGLSHATKSHCFFAQFEQP